MIKGTEVHNGLDGKEMRNFYQETLVTYYARRSALNKKKETDQLLLYKTKDPNDKFEDLRRRVKLYELEVDFAREHFKIAECELGLIQTMDGLNWEDWDMSDHIPCSGEHYRNFIGTKEEFETFISQFNLDNKK